MYALEAMAFSTCQAAGELGSHDLPCCRASVPCVDQTVHLISAADRSASCLYVQAAVVAARNRYQEARTVLDESVSAEQRMRADLVRLRSSIEQALRECR